MCYKHTSYLQVKDLLIMMHVFHHPLLGKILFVFRFDRVCVADTEVKGTKVPKGMIVIIPVHALSNDPDVWPNPEVFDPERYLMFVC